MPAVQLLEPAIVPAHVTIKAIAVNGRGMDMRLYHQVPRRDLWARGVVQEDPVKADQLVATRYVVNWPDLRRPLGHAWGTVHACPSRKCESASEHYHVIGERYNELVVDVVPDWQCSAELRRFIVGLPQLYVGVA